MLTIFTPTYNRGYIIENLYQSLLKQSDYNFEWLVIDDGSTDDTSDIFTKIYNENLPFEIRYYKKRNGGKHTAANLALKLALGEIFLVVDSDDILASNAVERIFHYYNQIKEDPTYCGVCGLKAFFSGKIIGTKPQEKILDTTIIDYRFHRKMRGDRADVFRTSLLKEHEFPTNIGEKWCPLSIVWNRFGHIKKVRYFGEIIYYAEYLPDGISLNRNKTRRNSPRNTRQYYRELVNYKIPFMEKFKACINFWRFGLYSNDSLSSLVMELGIFKSLISVLPGLIFYQIDKLTIKGGFLSPNKKIIKAQTSK